MKRNRIRLLVSLVLAVAIAMAGVGSAHASSPASSKTSTGVTGPSLFKPGARTADGEPDVGQVVTLQTSASFKTIGGMLGGLGSGSPWLLGYQWIWAIWVSRFAR
jgi:hypothetical protein